MGEGFIVRRGGGGQQTVKPIYNSFTADIDSLTLSVTNDSNSIATLYYSVVNNEPAPDQVGTFETEFAGKETKNITITGLTSGTTYTVYLKAIVVGEFPSETVIVSNLATQAIIYTAATGGTTLEYNSGGKRYKSHTFTSNGTFTVTTVGDNIDDRNKVDYLIIAGGGGGGYDRGGGGGAGGFRTTNGTSGRNSSAASKITVTATSYGITIGGGGNGALGGTRAGVGANSSALGVTSTGGGDGGSDANQGTNRQNAGNGGSGGGAGNPRASGSTPGPGISGQGFGGASYIGGGGGAGQAGQNPNGGNGLANLLRTGSNETRAGGGGGGGSGSASSGGAGGGGTGVISGVGGSGTVNTGGGGGGGAGTSPATGGPGGSGIVVIRYEIAPSV
jgi:hypothetical protein